MAIILCPTDCDCGWSFQHSLVTTERLKVVDKVLTGTRRTFLVCRDCGHWVNGGQGCEHDCHEEAQGSGVDVVKIDYGMINCS